MLIVTNGSQVEPLIKYNGLKIEEEVSAAFTVSFTSFNVPENIGHELLINESIVTVNEHDFVVKQLDENRFSKSVVAVHTFFNLSKDEYIKTSVYGGTHTFNEFMTFVLDGTGWTFTSDITASATIENFGNDNVIVLINLLRSRFGCEYQILPGKVVHFAQQIGPDNDAVYRYKHNIKALSKKVDTTDINNPKLTFELDSVELTDKAIGERVWLIYEPLNIELQTRVLKKTSVQRGQSIVTESVIVGNDLLQSAVDLFVKQKVELEESKKEYRSKFEQTDDRIALEVEQIGQSIASVNIRADSIEQSVVDLDDNLSSTITQTATDIRAEVKAEVTTINGSITTTNNNVSTLTQTVNAISATVTQHTTNLNSLGERLDSTELKITPTAIISTVTSSETYMNDTVEKSSTAPASPPVGKLWMDTSATPNILKRWDGSAWVKASPTTASEVGAYSQTDGSALASRMDSAELKITPTAITATVRTSLDYANDLSTKESIVHKATTAPNSPAVGKLWLDTSVTPNVFKRWDGTAWVKATPSTANEVGAYSQTDGSALATRMTSAESSITQNATNITLKVAKTDFTGANIVSKIELEASSATISASKINLLGITNVANTLNIGNSLQDSTPKGIYFRGSNGGVTISSPTQDNLEIGALGTLKLNPTTLDLSYPTTINWGTNYPTAKFG